MYGTISSFSMHVICVSGRIFACEITYIECTTYITLNDTLSLCGQYCVEEFPSTKQAVYMLLLIYMPLLTTSVYFIQNLTSMRTA